MQKDQSIGSNNQQEGLPENRNEDTNTSKGEPFSPVLDRPVKPAITDDNGNPVHKNSNEAKGYTEKKPTEAWSEVPPAGEPLNPPAEPGSQPVNREKVYGKGTDNFAEGSPGDTLPAHPPVEAQREEQGRKQD